MLGCFAIAGIMHAAAALSWSATVSERWDFGGVEDQQPIEPALLVIERAAERLYAGERSIERAFLFAKRATGC